MKKIIFILSFVLLTVGALGEGYKPGIYRESNTTIGSKYAATDYITIIINDEGKIQNVLIDSLLPIDEKDISKGYTSKQLVGDNYGMKKASKIGKNWDEQAEIISKNIVDNQGITFTVKEDRKTDGIVGATIKVQGYVELINKILDRAKI